MTVSSEAEAAVWTGGLTKRFGRGDGAQVAVDGVGVVVERGSIYGFLGPNGSGKTTTIRMLLGLLTPTEGTVSLLGQRIPQRVADVLPRVGALIEGPAFYPYLSGRVNLLRFDAANAESPRAGAAARVDRALERVGLTAAAGKRYRQYSLGMKQRLGLASALLVPRDLLVLDEPTNGLDPQGTREVRSLIRELAADGTTVLLSSHLLGEIQQVCSHVGVMSKGRLLSQGPVDELIAAESRKLSVTSPDVAAAGDVLQRLGAAVDVAGETLTIPVGDLLVEDVNRALVAAGVRVRGLVELVPSLEDVFVGLTGEGFDVER